MNGPHSAAATAASRLDNNRVTDFLSHFKIGGIIIAQRVAITWNTRNIGGLHGFFGSDFVTHHADGIGFGTDKGKTALFHFFRKISIFRQESISRVDGFSISHFCCTDNRRDVQVAVCG